MEENTLVILKPDGVKKGLLNVVIERFENENLKVSNLKVMQLTEELVKKHYSHLINFNFYPKLESFMLSGPVVVMIVTGDNAISKVREIIGTTDPKSALPNTIRGQYGEDTPRNVIHSSDSEESALIEIERFYGEEKNLDSENEFVYKKRR